jgi:hypothetical protein
LNLLLYSFPIARGGGLKVGWRLSGRLLCCAAEGVVLLQSLWCCCGGAKQHSINAGRYAHWSAAASE